LERQGQLDHCLDPEVLPLWAALQTSGDAALWPSRHQRELLPDPVAVAPKAKIAPGHHLSIHQNGRKRTRRRVDLLHIPQPIMDPRAVPSIPGIAPSDDRTIGYSRCKGSGGGLNLALFLPQLPGLWNGCPTWYCNIPIVKTSVC